MTISNGVALFCNFDLFQSKAASWRDTLQIRLGPTLPELEEILEVCRSEVVEWDLQTKRVAELLMAELLMEFLCEGLGLEAGKLKQVKCLEGRTMVGQYYLCCPEPDLTLGIASRAGPGAVTLSAQDHVGGLQVKCGDRWVEVKPVPGALVINIGDILQIMSNYEYRSAEHRVLANPSYEPQVSIAIFFNAGDRNSLYGPLRELISPEKPALYRQFAFFDFMKRFFTEELDGKSLLNYYKL